MKIYLAHPISGQTKDQVISYYVAMDKKFKDLGYEVLCPMSGKGIIRVEKEYRTVGYDIPVATNHAIFERDKWMVSQCDVLLCDLTNHSEFSIGCVMELAWGCLLGKHTVLILEEDSSYMHAFMLEAADIYYTNLIDAIAYLEKLIKGEIL